MIFYRFFLKTVAALLVLCLAVTAIVAGRVWWVARDDDRRPSDVIVVLGAAQFDGRPSSVFTARLDHARKLLEAKVAPRIVTVGGKREGDRFTEAAAGKRWLTTHGVPARRITAVQIGSNSLDSLQAVAERMREEDWRTAVLVTDPWHVLRVRKIARDEGIDAVASPTRQGPSVRTRGTQIRYVVRESFVYIYYRVFHRSPNFGRNAI